MPGERCSGIPSGRYGRQLEKWVDDRRARAVPNASYPQTQGIFVKVPVPDSALQVPDTAELRLRVFPSLSVVPLRITEPSAPLSPRNSKFSPVSVPTTFIEC